MAKRNPIDYDAIYHSLYDGDYRIIEDLGTNNNGDRKVIIQFLDTGNIQEVLWYRAKQGQARDRKKRIPDLNKEYKSNNYGPFIFLELLGTCGTDHNRAKIQFIDTGTIKVITVSDALNGNILDEYRPSFCGVACIGNADTNCREFDVWRAMIERCYNPKNTSYRSYGAKGISVCNRWLCFEYFLEDIKFLSGYDLWLNNPGEYALDKDILQMDVPENLKIYSPHTCCFVDRVTNSKYAAKYQNEMNESRTSKYMGVSRDHGTDIFRCIPTINNCAHQTRYLTEEAAAAMYNHVNLFYYPDIDPNLLNDVPYMTMDEIQAHRVGGKNMCNIVNKEMCTIIHK